MFKPHKDRCNICVGKDTGNVSKNNGDGNSVVYCCDIEALLISPRNKFNAMYYI